MVSDDVIGVLHFFAATVVTTIFVSSNKIQNGDILVLFTRVVLENVL